MNRLGLIPHHLAIGLRARFKSVRGTLFTEAAIVIPVLLILLLGFIDFFRYQAAQASLAYAAQSALSHAATVPGLEAIENVPDVNGAIPTTAVVWKSYGVARQQATSQLFGARLPTPIADPDVLQDMKNTIHLPIPVPTNAGSLDLAFQQSPIKVEMEARVPALMLPFIAAYPVRAEAVGYRENRQVNSNSVPLDCSGHQFVPGRPLVCSCPGGGLPNPATGHCSCTISCVAPKTLDVTACVCRCPAGTIDNGLGCVCEDLPNCSSPFQTITHPDGTCSCGCPAGLFPTNGHCCPAGQHWDDTAQRCVCDGACSVPPHQFDPATCACTCPAGTLSTPDGNCCPPGQISTNGVCGCAISSSECQGHDHSHQQFDPLTCQCICLPGYTMQNGLCCPTGQINVNGICQCPGNQHWDGNQCICANQNGACPGNEVRDPLSCECRCPNGCAGGVLSNDHSCICQCPPGQQADPTNSTCQCINQIPAGGCPSPQVWNSQSCSCACPASSNEQGCIQNPGHTFDPGSCSCRCTVPPVCGPNMVINPNDPCQCVCPASQGTSALCCPPGQHPVSATMCCRDGQILMHDGTCGCPDGREPDALGQCVCRQPWPNCNGPGETGMMFDPATCQCHCIAPPNPPCASIGRVEENCQCRCPTRTQPCPTGYVEDPATCQCVCLYLCHDPAHPNDPPYCEDGPCPNGG